MKRKDLLKRFSKKGWWIDREGAKHTVVTNGVDIEMVPRHAELNEELAKAIIKRRGL